MIVLCAMQIQVARIQCRVPEYGWTTQKVFQFLNFVVNGGGYTVQSLLQKRHHICSLSCSSVCCLLLTLLYFKSAARCSIFAFRRQVQQVNPPVWTP